MPHDGGDQALSMRGNVEFEVMRKLLDPDAAAEDKARKIDAMVNEETERIVGQWNDQVNPPIEPPPFEKLTDKYERLYYMGIMH